MRIRHPTPKSLDLAVKIFLTDTPREPRLIDVSTKKHTASNPVALYFASTGIKQRFAAQRWGVSDFSVTALVHFPTYRFSLGEEQWEGIAADLGVSADSLRRFYARPSMPPG